MKKIAYIFLLSAFVFVLQGADSPCSTTSTLVSDTGSAWDNPDANATPFSFVSANFSSPMPQRRIPDWQTLSEQLQTINIEDWDDQVAQKLREFFALVASTVPVRQKELACKTLRRLLGDTPKLHAFLGNGNVVDEMHAHSRLARTFSSVQSCILPILADNLWAIDEHIVIDWDHISKGDADGGLHVFQKGMQPLLTNAQTKVIYAPVIPDQSIETKNSSVFPSDLSEESVFGLIQKLVKNPRVRSNNRILIKHIDSADERQHYYVEMYLKASGRLVRSAFPIFSFVELDAPSEEEVFLIDALECTVVKTKRELIALVKESLDNNPDALRYKVEEVICSQAAIAQFSSDEPTTADATDSGFVQNIIVDVAPYLYGRNEVSLQAGLYVKLPAALVDFSEQY